ncbi:MAG: nitroreductase [Desulfomonile sp.]|nr:nitroreductase [Desulfomonile sp.]
MDVLETIRARKSIRAFTDEPVSREILAQVLKDASMAPSAINMQPWEVHMVLGEERKRLSRRLLRSYRERRITCGPGAARVIPEQFMQRSRRCAEGMAPLVQRMGSDMKTYINERGLDFYGAPAVALIFIDESFPPDRMTDVGLFAGYLVLAAAGHGLASCPIGLVVGYQDEIKDHLNIPESKVMVLSIALGKPDETAAINEFRSSRADLKEFVRWVD